MLRSLSVSGSVTLRKVCAWKHFRRQRTDVRLELVDRDDDVVGGDAAAMGVDRVVLEALHRRAFEDLHAVVHQHVLESLQALQRIDAVGAAVANAGGVALRAQDALELLGVVELLVVESHVLAAMKFGFGRLVTALSKTQEQRVLFQQATLDVVLLDRIDDDLDTPARRVPDLARGLVAVAAAELVQFQFTVGREESGAAPRRTAPDDVLVDQDDLQPLAQELRRG